MKAGKSLPVAFVALMLLSSRGGHDVVTYSEFRRIHPLMTLSDVEHLIGHKGRLLNGEHIDGVFVATTPGELVYVWQNKDGSNLSVDTLYGRVVAVSQTGL